MQVVLRFNTFVGHFLQFAELVIPLCSIGQFVQPNCQICLIYLEYDARFHNKPAANPTVRVLDPITHGIPNIPLETA